MATRRDVAWTVHFGVGMRALSWRSWSRWMPLLVAGCFSADADSSDSGGGCTGGGARGALGHGTFATSDCPGVVTLLEPRECLGLYPFAAGAQTALRFRPDSLYAPHAVTGVTSADPAVVRTDEVTLGLGEGAVEFVVATLAAGDATVQVMDFTEVIDELPIHVAPVASVVVVAPAKTLVGGVFVVSGTLTSASGEPLIGRRGYTLTAAPGLTIEALPPGTLGLPNEEMPDYVVHANAPGDYLLTAMPATSSPLRLTVVDPAALGEVQITASAFASGAAWFSSYVSVAATDDVGDALTGVACEWQASRPVTFESLERYPDRVVEVVSATNEPVDITCVIAGTPRATATIR